MPITTTCWPVSWHHAFYNQGLSKKHLLSLREGYTGWGSSIHDSSTCTRFIGFSETSASQFRCFLRYAYVWCNLPFYKSLFEENSDKKHSPFKNKLFWKNRILSTWKRCFLTSSQIITSIPLENDRLKTYHELCMLKNEMGRPNPPPMMK